MLKRLTTVLLFGGLLGLVPAAARAEPATPASAVQASSESGAGYDVFHSGHDDDHYRCMYRCDRNKRHYKHGHRYHRSYCWQYSKYHGWYKTRCGRHGGGHGHGGGHHH
jgi:hypothetical protein